MKKKILIIIIALVFLIISGVFVYNYWKSNGNYEIYIEKVDDNSPDRFLKVYRNGKSVNNYKYITFTDEKETILCYSNNPTANVFELDVEELIIVLSNNKKVHAKIIKEEIWKRKYYRL